MTAILIGQCCCKCCVNLRYRIWLIAQSPGLGVPRALEWEITQGDKTETGIENWRQSGVWAYAGYFSFHNETDTDKAPIYDTDPAAAMRVWINQPTGYIDVTSNSDEIIWTPPYDIAEQFCPGTVGQLSMEGSDHFTDSVYIQTGTAADLPPIEEWMPQGVYKYGQTQWREVELCAE